MVIAEFAVVPVGTGTPSVGKLVARAVNILKRHKKVTFQLTAMGTIVEGELADVLAAVADAHESIFSENVKRVVTRIVIDDRRDKEISADYKVQSVMKKLSQK